MAELLETGHDYSADGAAAALAGGVAAVSIIDAHHHVWDLAVRDQDWITAPDMARAAPQLLGRRPAPAARTRPESPPPCWSRPSRSRAETPEMLAVAAADPLVAGVVGWTDLTSRPSPMSSPGSGPVAGGSYLAGIRHQVQSEPDPDWLRRADVIRGLRAVAAAGLCYDLVVLPHQLAAATYAAAAVPGLTLVLDHAGKPPIASGALAAVGGRDPGVRRAAEHRVQAVRAGDRGGTRRRAGRVRARSPMSY